MSPLKNVVGKLPGSFSLRGLLLAIVLILTIPPLVVEAVLLYRYAEGERARAEAELEENAKGAANLIDTLFKMRGERSSRTCGIAASDRRRLGFCREAASRTKP